MTDFIFSDADGTERFRGKSNSVRQATRTLDNDAILALPTVGVVPITPTPDADGGRLVFLCAELVLRGTDGAVVPYGNVNGGATIAFGQQTGIVASAQLNTVSDLLENNVASSGTFWPIGAAGTPSFIALEFVTDLALALLVTNGGAGDFEDGDAGNALTVTVWYFEGP